MAIDFNESTVSAAQMHYSGKGYMDAKMQPVDTLEGLTAIPRAKRFVGLTVTVLNDGSGVPHDYWLQESTTKWVRKDAVDSVNYVTGDDVELKCYKGYYNGSFNVEEEA
jgi:hypothetical protein